MLMLAAVFVALPGSAHAAEGGWTQHALTLQHDLAGDVEMVNAPWVGTHNSYNSIFEMGVALSPLDSNQRIPIAAQLDAGVRSLEIDLHWFPSVRHLANRRPVVCHAQGPHIGCTTEKTLDKVLDEIRPWLRDHPDQVLMLYLEDHLDTAKGYDEGAKEVLEGLPGMVYKPRGRGCQELPAELTRDQILRSGRQVMVVSDCGKGVGWPAIAHAWSEHYEDQPTDRYSDFPACDSDVSRTGYKTRLIRYYEDSTTLSYLNSGGGSSQERITPEKAGWLVRCGVDLIGMDQLTRDDPRLDVLVWSWAPGQPASGDCSQQDATGRWRSSSCRGRLAASCREGIRWSVTTAVRMRSAGRACRREGGRLAVPRTGYEGQLLKRAMEKAGVDRAWLGQRRQGAGWQALDER